MLWPFALPCGAWGAFGALAALDAVACPGGVPCEEWLEEPGAFAGWACFSGFGGVGGVGEAA